MIDGYYDKDSNWFAADGNAQVLFADSSVDETFRLNTLKYMTHKISAVNKVIEDTRFIIREKYRMLQEKGELITGLAIKTAYLGVHALQKGHIMIDLVD